MICRLLGMATTSLLLAAAAINPLDAAELSINLGAPRTLDTASLLADPQAATITVPVDAAYGGPMTYRSVPLATVLGLTQLPEGQDLKLTAADGFITILPASLIFPTHKPAAQPWLAIEPPDQPWPKTPGGNTTGPFYLVWTDPAASGVMREQWPFAVVSIGLAPATTTRWPQLLVSAEVPTESLVRRGQDLVASQCMVCHPVAGAGDAAVGPDLNTPHSPTEYFEPWAFRAYIRDPRSLRSWDDMKMPGFPVDVLSDADVDAITAYLDYLTARR